MGFTTWMGEVDKMLKVRLRMTMFDFEDVPFGDLYDEGMTPKAVVDMIVAN
jgi:hypothetical protein